MTRRLWTSGTLLRWLICGWFAMGLAAASVAQKADDKPIAPKPPAVPTAEALTLDRLRARMAELEADAAIEPAAKAKLIEQFKAAILQFEAAQADAAATAEFRSAIERSPAAVRDSKAELDRLRATEADPTKSLPTNLSLAEAEQTLIKMESDATALRSRLKELEESLRTMDSRPALAREDLIAQKQALLALDQAPADPAVADKPLAEAQAALLAARRKSIPARIERLEQELASLSARQGMTTAARDLTVLMLANSDKRIVRMRVIVDEARQREAHRQADEAEQARRELIGKHPFLVAYADQTAALTSQLTELTQKQAASNLLQAAITTDLDQLREHQISATQIIQIGAGGAAVGELLSELRAKLPQTAQVRMQIAKRDQTIIDMRLQRLRWRDQLRNLRDPVAAVQNLLEEASNARSTPPNDARGRALLEGLITQRREAIKRLIDAQTRYIEQLAAMNSASWELANGAQKLIGQLDERLLWLPDTTPVGAQWAGQLAAGVRWLIQPAGWAEVGRSLLGRITSLPTASVSALLFFFLMVGFRRVLLRRLQMVGQIVAQVFNDSFLLTVRALLLSLLIAMTWPLPLGFIGWLLITDITAPIFVHSVGTGLMSIAILSMILGTFKFMCRDNGLFDNHFDWSAKARKVLGRNLAWLMALEAAAAFVVSSTGIGADDVLRGGLGRLAFIIGSFGLAVFAYRVLHPRRGAFADFIDPDGWIWGSRSIWFSLAVVAPAALGLLAAWGYFRTASQVQSRLFTTAWVALVGLIFYSLAMRWVVVAHRRLAVRRAREARESSQAARAAREAAEGAGEATAQGLEVPQIDLTSVSLQTRTLLRVVVAVGGLFIFWGIWSQIVPALGVLDEIRLWSTTVQTEQGDKTTPITLASLLLGVATIVIMVIASRNLPGVVEITALQRLSIDAGTRYAVTAICRYVIIAVGLVIAFDQIGVPWSQMQWIVAALGVGLGFGLQEIVANFVSGLIILFERPIRIGDTITVNALSGTVSRIQIRATTIVDWDNREIIVPNKSFITEQVINWSLSDPVTRLVIKVGIAYGSDTALAHRIMLETAQANPLVLQTPGPTVFFLGFGDSSLNFEIRVFVRDLLKRMPLMHELHMAIDKALREHNIEIPFPQRDLHIRSGDLKPPVA